jgi:hypothetical protein
LFPKYFPTLVIDSVNTCKKTGNSSDPSKKERLRRSKRSGKKKIVNTSDISKQRETHRQREIEIKKKQEVALKHMDILREREAGGDTSTKKSKRERQRYTNTETERQKDRHTDRALEQQND